MWGHHGLWHIGVELNFQVEMAEWEGEEGRGKTSPETTQRDSKRCGNVLKRNVMNISKITQTEDRLPGGYGNEYG